MSTVKRGVSLYSYQQEYYLGKMDLEACVAAVANLGCDGVELITEAMVPDFPNPSDEFIERWFGLMDKYKTRPTCYDAFLDTKLYKTRLLSKAEQVEMFTRDIKLAARMGFDNIRVLASVGLDVIEEVIPVAESYNVRLGSEIHAPRSLGMPIIGQIVELAERKNTKYYGLTPDLGIFVRRLPRVLLDSFIRKGATPAIVKHIDACYQQQLRYERICDDIRKMGANAVDYACAMTTSHYVCSDPGMLKELIPHIIHIHAKFYEMTEDLVEWSIPNEEIVPVLTEGGWNGYLSSEYEGQRHWHDLVGFEADSVEQVRRQHEQLKILLKESCNS